MITFVRKDAYHQQSDCKRFVVTAYSVRVKLQFWAFDFSRKPHQVLGIVDSADKARVLCEQTLVRTAA